MVKKILGMILSLIFIGWIGMIMYDAIKSTEGKPTFCISKEIRKYTDGTIEICHGLGYNVYVYDREKYHGIEFVPFWVEVKEEIALDNQQ